MAVGVVCDAIYGTNGAMTLSLTLLGAAAGITAQYLVRQNLVGCVLCSAAGLFLIELFRVGWRLLFQVADLAALLRVAAPEFLFSMLFTPLLYAIFHWVWRPSSTGSGAGPSSQPCSNPRRTHAPGRL